VREVGSWGTGDGQFRDPCGVAFAANGDIWVADRGNHRIHHLDASGKVLRAIGFRGKIEGQLENPSGLAVSPDGKNIYVADRGNDRVAVFNLDGACTGIIGDGTGKAPGCMQGPCGVAMRSDGQLAVCDYGNNRIQIFDAKGACAMILGRNEAAGEGRHRLLQPSAVCYNREGLVVVADYGNHRVVVFGEDGNVCKEIVGGEQGGSFNGPSAVGVNR
jgi:tripartite motif-containing protein 71